MFTDIVIETTGRHEQAGLAVFVQDNLVSIGKRYGIEFGGILDRSLIVGKIVSPFIWKVLNCLCGVWH